jgi:thiol-disulfide isomerase/thioredoxin
MFVRLHVAKVTALSLASLAFPAYSMAQSPTAAEALKLKPVQRDVDFDLPAEKDLAKCTIKAERINGHTGWIVRDPNGQMLREFVDTNKDNTVDRWSYFKDGIEVYRDVDEDFNNKADNHRWLNTGGTRWGLDKTEDGRIDSWKKISPEEVTAELVMALRDRDEARFARLLVTPTELKTLGLSPEKSKELSDKVGNATTVFKELVRRQKIVGPKTTWVHFGATKPGLVPAGTDGSRDDLVAYENVLAMIETEGKDGQLPVGTIVKVGDMWRLIDAPPVPDATGKAPESSGFFFAVFNRPTQPVVENVPGAPSEKVQQLIDAAQKLDAEINKTASREQQGKLNDERADLMEQVIDEIDAKERAVWVRGFADTVSAAVQGGTYPKGLERLQKMFDRLEKAEDKELAAYVRFRHLTAEYGASLQEPNPDFAKIQTTWLDNLEKYATDFPESPDAADAMLQLGLAQEVAGQEAKAKAWYTKIVGNFPQSAPAKKAAGAVTRLECVGKSIQLRGKAATGETVDLSKAPYKGKVVLIHYWATWCEPCKVDIAQLKELQAKYGRDFQLVGISLDTASQDLSDYLKRNRLPWPQLFEPGGLDSRYANELGVLTLPTMLLIDSKGKVVNRGIHITEVDNELKKLLE